MSEGADELIEIWCWDWIKGIHPGHVALGFDDLVFGIFHIDPYVHWETGVMKKQNHAELAEEWFNYYLSKAPVCRLSDDGSHCIPSSVAYRYVIDVEQARLSKIQEWCMDWQETPKTYHRREKNCVTETVALFRQLNLYDFSHTYKPHQFRQELASLLGRAPTTTGFTVVREEELEARWQDGNSYYWAVNAVRNNLNEDQDLVR